MANQPDHIHHIHNVHSEKGVKVHVEKRKSSGRYEEIDKIPSNPPNGGSAGPYDQHDLTDLRITVRNTGGNRPVPVYFKFIEATDRGDKNHMDGQVGHPGDDG